MPPLDGVIITPLKIVPDDRGQVMKMLQADAPHFEKFGEIYFSCIYPGIIKGWKLHSRIKSNLAVPIGRVKFVLYDRREGSPTKGQFQEVYLGENSYQLLTVPPGVAYAWKNLVPSMALVANCATEPWQAEEAKNLLLADIPYLWDAK